MGGKKSARFEQNCLRVTCALRGLKNVEVSEKINIDFKNLRFPHEWCLLRYLSVSIIIPQMGDLRVAESISEVYNMYFLLKRYN